MKINRIAFCIISITVAILQICNPSGIEKNQFNGNQFVNHPDPGGVKYLIIMANTYSQICIQIVFAVQNRQALINPSW